MTKLKENQKTSRSLYLPQLDSMRFFAFLSVFFFHCLPNNDVGLHKGHARIIALVEATVHRSGENGVALFFLLSAFLITELLRREKDLSGSIHLKMFYIRRALRIWPLYYLALTIGLILQPFSPLFRLSTTEILTYVFFLKNWDVVLHGFSWNPIYILWTISSEEQFYLLWPLAQQLLSKRRMLFLCAAALVVIPLVTFWPGGIFLRHHMTQMAFLFMFFPLGGILSFVLDGRRSPLSLLQCTATAILGFGLWLGGTLLSFPSGDYEGPLSMLIAGKMIILVGTLLIFLAFLKSDPAWSPKFLIYLGKISYGLYVFHIMSLLLVIKITNRMGLGLISTEHSFRALAIGLGTRLPLALAVTIVIATLSYEIFEKRFLRLKDKFAVIHSRAA